LNKIEIDLSCYDWIRIFESDNLFTFMCYENEVDYYKNLPKVKVYFDNNIGIKNMLKEVFK